MSEDLRVTGYLGDLAVGFHVRAKMDPRAPWPCGQPTSLQRAEAIAAILAAAECAHRNGDAVLDEAVSLFRQMRPAPVVQLRRPSQQPPNGAA